MTYVDYVETPLGSLKLTFNADFELVAAQFIESNTTPPVSNPCGKEEIQPIKTQIQEYFEGKRIQFTIKLAPKGTEFQKRVWNELLKIPFGETRSYQQIATLLGDPKVIRAAASANGKNPIALIIPCHRVIGSDGSLTGYAGGMHRKKWLLQHENPSPQQSLF